MPISVAAVCPERAEAAERLRKEMPKGFGSASVLESGMENLKERAVRGGVAKLAGQGVSFFLRLGYMMVLARLLNPDDFGLVAMATVVTGVYELFTSAGLQSAVIQQSKVTNEQVSKLFWINILVGLFLTLLCMATAPVLVKFFNDPRLFWVTIAIAPGFMLTAASVQHLAILERQLRYPVLTLIEIASLIGSVTVGIGMAVAGFGYWAIVCAALAAQLVSMSSAMAATRWVPGRFTSGTPILSMVRYGLVVTVHNVVIYVAYNFDKLLLGRYWGADALGIYGRAYQLISIPTSALNAAVGGVAFSALSRLQDDPDRLKSYFLKGYSLVVSMTIPVTIFCAAFADDIILVVLGPKWSEATLIFRLMTPTILIFAMINPLSWLLFSAGLQKRSLKIALVMTVLLITSYFIGLPYGPSGVAGAYSAAMALWLLPHIFWCLHKTTIVPRDLFIAIGRPLLAGIIAVIIPVAIELYLNDRYFPSILKVVAGGGTMFVIYSVVLLFVLNQKDFYLDLLRGLKLRQTSDVPRSAI